MNENFIEYVRYWDIRNITTTGQMQTSFDSVCNFFGHSSLKNTIYPHLPLEILLKIFDFKQQYEINLINKKIKNSMSHVFYIGNLQIHKNWGYRVKYRVSPMYFLPRERTYPKDTCIVKIFNDYKDILLKNGFGTGIFISENCGRLRSSQLPTMTIWKGSSELGHHAKKNFIKQYEEGVKIINMIGI